MDGKQRTEEIMKRREGLVLDKSEEIGKKKCDNKSVSKTLAILSTFDEKSPMQRTSDIARKLDMNVSTASRHLNTLLDCGFLKRNDETGYYYPGTEIIVMAGAALQNNEVYRYSFPELQLLSFRYGVHSHMSMPQDIDIIHMISSCCEHTMDLFVPMGHMQPMYCSAMGRCFLAYMPRARARDILKRSHMEKRTPETKVDIEEICLELERIRRQGYCLISNELTYGKASLAAPVFDRSQNAIAAISVSTSANALKQPQREAELRKAVKNTAGRISGRLGYFPY